MSGNNPEMEDELREEYDLEQLNVRKLGPKRKSFGSIAVRLEPDVAAAFPDADAVNKALRSVMRQADSDEDSDRA